MLREMPVVRFAAKVLSQSATAVLATLIGGYALTLINVRSPEPQTAAEPAAADQRALTREFVKSLREGHADEDVAEVRPTPAPVPSNETVVSKVAPEATISRAAPPARKENRLRPDVASTSGVTGTATSARVQADAAPALGAPIVLAPTNVAAVSPATPQAPQMAPRREHPTVFSAISTFIGNAANATGDSINFMIDLPGRALGGGKERVTSAPAPVRERQPAVGEAAPPMQFAGS